MGFMCSSVYFDSKTDTYFESLANKRRIHVDFNAHI